MRGAWIFVLSPKEIAEKLIQIGTHPYVATGTQSPEAFNFPDNDLGRLFNLVSRRTGVDFSQYKPATLRRRIQRADGLAQIFSELRDYVQYRLARRSWRLTNFTGTS